MIKLEHVLATNMSAELYPLTLEPMVAEQLWGFSEKISTDETVPTGFNGTLLLAVGNSKIAAGPLAGKSLGHLRQLWSHRLVGSISGGNPDVPLPVELKLKRVSGSALAVALTEESLWYVMGVEEGATLHAGFNPGLNFRQAAQTAGSDFHLWTQFMPEYEVHEGQCLCLPAGSPLLIGPGLALAQISAPTGQLSTWPLPAPLPEGLTAAEATPEPIWLAPRKQGPDKMEFFRSPKLKLSLITTSHLSDIASPEAATFLWPVAGQGRIRARGPAPVTRLQPGRVIMLPADLGRYAIESGGTVSYLLIEAF